MVNILEILKDAPIGTKLYSPIFGDCELDYISETGTYKINVKKVLIPGDTYTSYSFSSDGRYLNEVGECLLFPSSEKRNWDGVIFRRNLEEGTPVLCSDNPWATGWNVRKYSALGESAYTCQGGYSLKWKYIIPVSKFDFENNSWNKKDNYGTGDSK